MLRNHIKTIFRRLAASGYQPLNHIELSQSRLVNNLEVMRAAHPGAQLIPVLKGNAYGHGIEAVADMLRSSGCRLLAVDGYFEAERILSISGSRVLVMGYILPANVSLLDTRRCSFVVQDVAGLHAFGGLNKTVRIHLELNTGMNRLGLRPQELAGYLEVLAQYPQLELEGVMTHLADADNPADETANRAQLRIFDRQIEVIHAAGFQPSLIHLAQTAGSPKVHSQYANAVRPGLGIYGLNPLVPEDPLYTALQGLQPILELKSTIIKVLELYPGDKVSYNGTFTAQHSMRVGVLPLGYYEGVPRALSNRGCVMYQSRSLAIVGRVCMNHTIINLADTDLAAGDEVTVVSCDSSLPNSVQGWQDRHGLFVYSSLAGLSSSIKRKLV